MTDFYLSGSLKNRFSKLFKLCLITVFTFSAPLIFAQNDLDKTYHYTPGGKYRMFGAGRGTVEKVRNTIKPTANTSSKAGPLRLDAQSYAGYVHYEQRFSNHPLSEHGPFVNDRTMEVGDFHGSIINGQAGVAKAKITGREWHPTDAYDAADGGDHPYDSYYYYVHGTVHSVSVQPIELPKLPNPFSNKNADVGQNESKLPEKNAATENDRTRDLTGSGNLPNSPNGQPESSDVANNGEVPLPQALPQPQSSFWDGFAAGFTNGAVNTVSDFVNVVTHPADTVRNIGGAAATVATNPSAVSEAVVDAYDQKRAAIENAQNSFERGVESGSTTAAMATFFIPGGQAGKVQTAGAVLGKAAKTTDSVSDVAKAAKKVEKAEDTAGAGSKAGRGSSLPVPEPTKVTTSSGENLVYQSNPKHTAGQQEYSQKAGTEPKNSGDIFSRSVQAGDKRYAQDNNGNIHQFHNDGNGTWHWAGSTSDKTVPLKLSDNLKKELKKAGMNSKVLKK